MSHVRIAYDTFQKTAPAAQATLIAMGRTADESGLDKEIVELAKLRVSQINNCDFCLQTTSTSRASSASPRRSSTWWRPGTRAASFPSASARRSAWAEALTHLASRSVSDAAYDAIRKHFSENELVYLSTSIATINAWNRLGAAFRFAPPIPRKAVASKAA